MPKKRKPPPSSFFFDTFTPPPPATNSDKPYLSSDTTPSQTAIIYCEGHFGKVDGKTANGLVRHSEKYKIEGFPTVILLDENQKEFTRFYASEYPSISKFLKHLDRSLDRMDLE